MKRANRLVHALTVSRLKGIFFSQVYSPVSKHPLGNPFNILLTYYYMRPYHNGTNEHIDIMRAHRKMVGDALIIIDSGVFSYFSVFGVDTATHTESRDHIISEGMSRLPEIFQYTKNYAEFLRDTSQYWDIAVDFDADSFLEEAIVDKVHEELIDTVGVDRSRFMRVFHYERPDCRGWWKRICQDPRYKYLGIGSGNRRDWEFYTHMTEFAHKYDKKVHAFGLGSPSFLKSAPVDLADTTSHLVGGRFGRVFTPIGIVSFASNNVKDTLYDNLDPKTKQELADLWENKYHISVEQLRESPYVRNTLNIWHMNEFWDVPYERKEKILPLFDMMGV